MYRSLQPDTSVRFLATSSTLARQLPGDSEAEHFNVAGRLQQGPSQRDSRGPRPLNQREHYLCHKTCTPQNPLSLCECVVHHYAIEAFAKK